MSVPQPDEPLRPDYDAALDFLFKRIRSSPVHLTRINPHKRGAPICEVFRSKGDDLREDTRAWIEKWNGQKHWNVYVTLGELRRDIGEAPPPKGKPSEDDVRAVKFFAVDLDPRKIPSDWTGTGPEWVEGERHRILPSLTTDLPEGAPGPPTWVVDSGGGYWGIWALSNSYAIEDKAHDIAHAKSHGERLIEQYRAHFGDAKSIADGVANLDRLCRLPGTVNYPDKKKREEKGRYVALASVVEEHCSDRRYPLYAFQPPEGFAKAKSKKSAGRKKAPKPSGVTCIDTLDLLPQAVPDLCKVVIAQGCDPDDPGRFGGTPSKFGLTRGADWNGDRSAAVWYVACELVRSGVDDDTIRALLLDEGWGVSAHVRDQKDPEGCAERQIEQALEEVGDDVHRPVIYADPGRLAQIVEEGFQALLNSDEPVYQRGKELVFPVVLDRSQDDGGVRRERGATVIHPASASWLTVALARAAEWLRHTPKGKIAPTDPQVRHALAIMSQVGSWPFPVLQGIVNAPTLRADGSILQVPGYDSASGLIFEPGGVEFPPIPDRPTKDQAVTALAEFEPLFAGFPFVDEAAKAVVWSGILSGLVGQMLPSIPLHAFDAPTAGSGKSLLAETIGAIVLGFKPSLMNQGKEEAEDEKRLATALRAGDRVIWIDNCNRPIEGDTLCSILTQESVKLRILGRSEQVELPCNVLVLATGNNLIVSDDMTRRSLVCRLDARVERPDRRQFDFDPRRVASARRVDLVVAGLTALRAYIAADRPGALSPVGSFEGWSALVREALVWCGYGDPDETRTAILDDDPKKAALIEVLETWFQWWGDNELTVRQAREADEVEGVLIEATNRPLWSSKSVGWYLKRNLDRVVGGLVLRRAGETGGVARWRVEATDGRSGTGGDQTLRYKYDREAFG